MRATDLLLDGFDRVGEVVRQVTDGLTGGEATARLDTDANPVGWLVWHLSRVQDAQVAEVVGGQQVWTQGGFAARFGLPSAPAAIGYGQSSAEVGAFGVPEPGLLLAYHEAVQGRTAEVLAGLTDGDLDRVIDDAYNPPVTVGNRLVSTLADCLQHAGQAAYVLGMLRRR